MTTENIETNLTNNGNSQSPFIDYIPAIRSEFRRSDEKFCDLEKRPGFWDFSWVPLTAIRGPHSDRISAALLEHNSLKNFAQGVDERAVYSATHAPCNAGFVDWETDNDNEPLAFAFFDVSRDCYEISCFELVEVEGEKRTLEYRIKIHAIFDLHFSQTGPKFIELFVDIDNPLTVTFQPEEYSAKTDIIRLSSDHFLSSSECLNRLTFLTEVLGDPSTQLDPA